MPQVCYIGINTVGSGCNKFSWYFLSDCMLSSCIQGTTAFVVDKHDIIGIDLRHGQQIFKVPALGLAEDECIWNIHVSGPLTSICTVFRNLEAEAGGHPKVM